MPEPKPLSREDRAASSVQTRDDAIAALEEHKLEQRAAVRALRDAHRKVLDARLKEEYRKNREAASATGGASVRAH